MLLQWDKLAPKRLDSIFAALTRVRPSHLLDRELFDFAALGASGAPLQWLMPEKEDDEDAPETAKPQLFRPLPTRPAESENIA